jgi:PilZ domain
MRRTRAEPRKVFLCRITITWESETDGLRSQTGLIEDRSRSGAGVTVDEPIPVGTIVKIRGRRRELAAVVKYCFRKSMRYVVGVEYEQADEAWSVIRAGL